MPGAGRVRAAPAVGVAPSHTWPYHLHRAQVMGRCQGTTGIVPFGRLVEKGAHDRRALRCQTHFSIVQRKVVNPNDFTDLDEIPGSGESSAGPARVTGFRSSARLSQ